MQWYHATNAMAINFLKVHLQKIKKHIKEETSTNRSKQNEVCEGYVFTRVCHSVHRGAVFIAMHCRWYPSMPCRFPGSHPGGELRGLARGVSRPTPGGSPGHTQGGHQAHTQGAVSLHALRQTVRDTRYASYWNAFLL